MSSCEISPVLVVGAGLVGASIGRALEQAGVQVHLHDIDRAHAMVAASRGAGTVDEPAPDDVRLVVVATPPASAAQAVLDALARYPRAAVTDVASVKASVQHAVVAGTTEAIRYVGSHPMAGSQHVGPLTAIPELFVDRTWVLAPRPDNPAWVLDRVRALIATCHAQLVELDAAEHDAAVARVSHLPQLMSSLTAARLVGAPPDQLRLAGQGVRDVTRIAASDPALWQQIIDGNRDEVLVQLRAVQADLDALVERLECPGAVADLVGRGRAGTQALPGKHGRTAAELVAIVVEIPDAPGALARLFADIEACGVNIEDLSIEHDQVREVGYLAIQIEPDRAEALGEALVARRWSLRV